jgi:hypothetical protein
MLFYISETSIVSRTISLHKIYLGNRTMNNPTNLDIWQAAQFNLDPKTCNTIHELESFVKVYVSDSCVTLPTSSNLMYDVYIAYTHYVAQFITYITENKFGWCEDVYNLNVHFKHYNCQFPTYTSLANLTKRQKFIYSILVKSVRNYVGSY